MNAMQPTRTRLLVGIAVVTAAIGWGVVQIVDAWFGRLVPVPWLAAGSMWLLAGAVAYWAFTSRPRLQGRPGAKPMPPLVAARTAALAMAASRIGALVMGFYAGIAAGMAPNLATPSGLQIFWAASAAALGGLALVAAALWLEHLCRLPTGPDDGARP
jgi:ABC-type thiamin/hydroxymethylpyrimidine transport system permease subunit